MHRPAVSPSRSLQPHQPPRTPRSTHSRQQNNNQSYRNINNQLMHANEFPSKVILEDLISEQGSLKEDLNRNDKTVTAVRQENIMLAEKVHHATNLYRQLLGRVSKSEERMDSEHKAVTNIISQAKQVEVQLLSQQEQLMSRESQLVLKVQRLQEEMALLKTERGQSRKHTQQLSQEVRDIQDKIARQTGALSNGLKDLKAHLDQKDQEKNLTFNMMYTELRDKVDTEQHQRTMFQTQVEGRLETMTIQIIQSQKQQQDDVYQINTLVREKEALAKADVRRLQEKFKVLLDEFNKSIVQNDDKTRNDLCNRITELERKFINESRQMHKKFQEFDNEADRHIQELRDNFQEDMEQMRGNSQNSIPDVNDGSILESIAKIDKQAHQNKKDIEKVVRAEIFSRLSQGEKLTQKITESHKSYNEGLTTVEDMITNNKRKQEHALETYKHEVAKMFKEHLNLNKTTIDDLHVVKLEQKLEEVEDALDDFAKQDERIELNSERIKQIEMENILAQGDMSNTIDGNTKKVRDVSESLKDLIQAVKLLEMKLKYLADAFESNKTQQKQINDALITPSTPYRKGTPRPMSTPRTTPLPPLSSRSQNDIKTQINQLTETVNILKSVVTSKIEAEHKKDKKDMLLIYLTHLLKEINVEKEDDWSDDDEKEDKKNEGKGEINMLKIQSNNEEDRKNKENGETGEEEEGSEEEEEENYKRIGGEKNHKGKKTNKEKDIDVDDDDDGDDDDDLDEEVGDEEEAGEDEEEDDEEEDEDDDDKNKEDVAPRKDTFYHFMQ